MSEVSFDSATFRRVLGHYPTGVCVVTAAEADGAPVGMVVGSFTSVSLDPPLVAFFPAKSSTSWPRIAAVGRFCVNVLASDQTPLCRQIAGPGPDKFAGIAHRVSANGSPILDDVVAWIDCSLDAVHEAGDHHIVIGRVVALEVERPERPLLFFQGSYGEFALLQLWTKRSALVNRWGLWQDISPAPDRPMTALLITVDTELSASLHQRGIGLAENLRRSIWAETDKGAFGIGWQMDLLERHGLKGVFFLDPMPALVHGADFLAEVVGPIVARGHEVQMHIHSEWLQWAERSPVEGRQGRNIGDFALADQTILLGLAKRLLEEAGAPPITAFRAGNFGANDDTLRALAAIGVAWDSSVNPAYLRGECRIAADPAMVGAARLHGVSELPVSGIADRPGGFRPAQICAMSAAEMRAGIAHAARAGQDAFVVVTHSFEMLSRDRMRPNRLVIGRFEALCRAAARLPQVKGAGFNDLPADLADRPDSASRAGPSRLRTGRRILEQAWGTWRYEHRLVPA